MRWRTCLQWCACGGTVRRNASSARWINSQASTSAACCLRRRSRLCSPAPWLSKTWRWASFLWILLVCRSTFSLYLSSCAIWFACFVFSGESTFYHAGGYRYVLCGWYLYRTGDSAASELPAWIHLSGEWTESGRSRPAVAQLDASA